MSITLPTPSCLVPEHQADPAEQEMAWLEQLAKTGCELTRKDVDSVLHRVPLLVLADDEPTVRTAVFRIMTARRKNTNPVVKLEGDIQQCFDALPKMEAGHLPVVLCQNGAEAETAARILCERQIKDGIVIFDYLMGGPTGLEIFEKFEGDFPPGITKTLLTGTPPERLVKCLEAGILDAAIIKPPSAEQMRAKMAQTYLRKKFSPSGV